MLSVTVSIMQCFGYSKYKKAYRHEGGTRISYGDDHTGKTSHQWYVENGFHTENEGAVYVHTSLMQMTSLTESMAPKIVDRLTGKQITAVWIS